MGMLYAISPMSVALDGVDITSDVTRLTLSESEDSVHPQISVECQREPGVHDAAWSKADPADQRGAARLVVACGGRAWRFLLEEWQGGESQATLSGRGYSACWENPYQTEVAVAGPGLASALAAALVPGINWLATDWLLPDTWSFEGLPVAGVQALAAKIGAIVQGQADGALVVRPRYAVAPSLWDTQAPAAELDTSNMLTLTVRDVLGDGYNAVTVYGAGSDIELPTLEAEDPEEDRTEHIIKEDVHVRAYFRQGGYDADAVSWWVNAGSAAHLGYTVTEEKETVYFENGVASTQRPVTALLSWAWIGEDGGAITAESGSSELEAAGGGFGVAMVRYSTTYHRFRLYGHDVGNLQFVLFLAAPANTATRVVIGADEVVENPAAIEDADLSSEAARLAAATAQLYANYYDTRTASVETPYMPELSPGALAHVDDALLSASGNWHVVSVETTAEAGRVFQRVEMVQCRTS